MICLWISSLNSMQIYVWSVNWCVCASVCFSPASSLARGCSLTLQLYIKPKTQVKVCLCAFQGSEFILTSSHSCYLKQQFCVHLGLHEYLCHKVLGFKNGLGREKNISNEGISTSYQGGFLCQSLMCGSAYASLQMHLFIFELMHSSNVTFTRFS